MRVSCHFVLRARRPARSTLFPYTTLFRSTITQDTLNRVRNLGRGHDNFIPIDLRNRLDADADQADRNGDRACAAILRQMAAYTGTNAPQPARDLGVSACTNRYAAARELMQLVVAAEEEV